MHPTQWERVSRRLTRHNANYSYLCVCIKWITNNYKEIAAILHWLYLIINLSTYSFSFIEYLLINFYWQFIYKVFIDNFFMQFFIGNLLQAVQAFCSIVTINILLSMVYVKLFFIILLGYYCSNDLSDELACENIQFSHSMWLVWWQVNKSCIYFWSSY